MKKTSQSKHTPGTAEPGKLKDVYEWLASAPKLRDSFLFAVCGPDSKNYTEDEKKNALAPYTRDDVLTAYDLGFC